MESVVKIASYISNRYFSEFGTPISEMKLHKLLYFTQRESIIQTGNPMFPEEFLAWRYGPVVTQIRSLYAINGLNNLPSEEFISLYKSVFDQVFTQYAVKDAWSLSRLSHGEISWKNARRDLLPEQNGSNILSIDDIKKDAERVKLNRTIIDVVNHPQ
jgi:uncharacterized phage-associated protein